jgi:hypothetical protein
MVVADVRRAALMALLPLVDSTVTPVHSVAFGSRRQVFFSPAAGSLSPPWCASARSGRGQQRHLDPRSRSL